MRDQQAVTRFQREMKAIGKLDHPNIVRATDARAESGKHFLVMEMVEGINVSELLSSTGPVRTSDACELIRQAAVGLHYVHELGLIHRDIKPSNLMLSTNGQVKILDFGLARLNDRLVDADLTLSGQILGTLDYVAPEQAKDSHAID